MLWVKGSGTDLATITTEGFAGLRLDELLPLRELAEMDDATMVEYLLRCGLRPDQPRPSIETLLHAFVAGAACRPHAPGRGDCADLHPDAAASSRKEHFGPEAVWLDYQRPGFDMSRRIALLLEDNPEARAVLLERHGLVTWGETGDASYRATLEFVARAAEAIETAGHGRFGLGGPRSRSCGKGTVDPPSSRVPCPHSAARSSPTPTASCWRSTEPGGSRLRLVRARSRGQPGRRALPGPPDQHQAQAARRRVRSGSGRRCRARARLRAGVDEYSAWYRRYYERNVDDETRPFPIDPAGPRVVLVPGIGIVTTGSDAGRARIARDLYHRAIAVQDAADALGGFRSLSESEAFAIEYWPLERYKLAQAPPRGELAGRVAVITGGASGIGRAAARALAERGAHVVIGDLNAEGAAEVAEEVGSAYGLRRALAVPVDVTDEAAVQELTRRAVLEYGGIDILVSSAGLATSAPITETTLEEWELNYAVLARGYFLASREAFRVMEEQGRGGSIVFVASKNALVAGANAAAYSSAKAASLHLARCLAEEGGSHGIRVNTVNPDAVIQGSGIWSSDWKAERASAYGVAEEELQSFYRERTKLGVSVYPEDVAEAIAFLAGPRAAKSTGNVLNVDGGVTAAYPR